MTRKLSHAARASLVVLVVALLGVLAAPPVPARADTTVVAGSAGLTCEDQRSDTYGAYCYGHYFTGEYGAGTFTTAGDADVVVHTRSGDGCWSTVVVVIDGGSRPSQDFCDSNVAHELAYGVTGSGSHTIAFRHDGDYKGLRIYSFTVQEPDVTAPTAPTALAVEQNSPPTGSTFNVSWTPGTDDVEVQDTFLCSVVGNLDDEPDEPAEPSCTQLGGWVTSQTLSGALTDHVVWVYHKDAAGNRSESAVIGYTHGDLLDGTLPDHDPVTHPLCSVLVAGYDNTYRDNVRVYLRCFTPSGEPATWKQLGANRINVEIMGQTDVQSGDDTTPCLRAQVDVFDPHPTTVINPDTASASFLIGTGAGSEQHNPFYEYPDNKGCSRFIVGGGHEANDGVSGYLGRVVGRVTTLGGVLDKWLQVEDCGDNRWWNLTEESCSGWTGSSVTLDIVTPESYPAAKDQPWMSLAAHGEHAQTDENPVVDWRAWSAQDETAVAAGATGAWEACGPVDFCPVGGQWGQGAAVGEAPAGYVPGAGADPDEPDFNGDGGSGDTGGAGGCDFSILDPSSYLCGIGGILDKLLGVVRNLIGVVTTILDWLQNLGSFLSGLLVPDVGEMQADFAGVGAHFDGTALGSLWAPIEDVFSPITGLAASEKGPCEGPEISAPLPFMADTFDFHPLDACAAPVQTALGYWTPIASAMIYLATLMGAYKAIAGNLLGRDPQAVAA